MATSPSADSAGVIAPAPVFFAVALAAGFAAERAASTTLLWFPLSAWLASAFVATSIAIFVSAFGALARARTAFDARKSTTRIVTRGAFRFSRNPTYLSLTLLHVGIAFAVESLWVLLTAIAAVGVTHWGVILREEHYLAAKFGEEYRNYAATVRRWL